jgi:hypothetical protein
MIRSFLYCTLTMVGLVSQIGIETLHDVQREAAHESYKDTRSEG